MRTLTPAVAVAVFGMSLGCAALVTVLGLVVLVWVLLLGMGVAGVVVVVLPGVGHLPQEEAEAASLVVVAAFLAQ